MSVLPTSLWSSSLDRNSPIWSALATARYNRLAWNTCLWSGPGVGVMAGVLGMVLIVCACLSGS